MDNRAQIIIGADNQAGRGINQAKKDLRELGTAADRSGRQTKDSFRQATVSSNSLSGSISKLYVGMASLAALVGAGALARGFLETAASMERTRLMLEGLTGSTKEAQASMDWLLKFATTAPYQLSTLSDTFVKLRIAGIDPTAGSMQALVDAVAAFGGSNEQLQRASVAIMQMAGKGVISMEELRQQLGEAVPDAIHVMAHEMGMTVRDLTDMVSKGNLDALTGLTALFEGWAKKHKGAAEKFSKTMGGLWNQIKLQYELFKYEFMNSGDSFISLKAALKTTLDLIKRWREDGSIVEWSEHAVKAMGVVVEGIHYIGKAFLGWKVIWEGLKAAWDATVAGIYASVAWLADKMGILLEKLADVQEFLNFDAIADRTRIAAAGMREWADETSDVADVLIDDIATKGVKGIEDAVAAIINLDQKTAQLKASFYDNVEAMKAQAKAGKDAGSATAEGIEQTTSALEKLDPKLEAAHQKLRDFLAIHSQADDAARSIAKLNIEYNRMAEQLTDMQLAGYEVVEMSEQLEQWYANSMEDITKKTEETTDTIYDTWSHMYERLQDITADWIYDMKVDFDSIVDLFKRTVAEMISAWIWGQQNMQFATSGQGGFSLGGMFGGMSGGWGGTPQPGDSNFIGPLQQGAQGAQSAYSLYGAYNAYGTAGGGWAGAKAGAGSFFGGFSSISWTTWAAIALIAESLASKANVRSGYGRIEGGTGGYGEYQPGTSSRTSFMGLDMFNEAISTYLRGLVGWDEPTATGYQSKALQESDWENFLKASAVASFDPLGLVESALGSIGIDLGKIFGYSNKKRSYLGREYTFDEYSPETGWGEPGMVQYKDKRKGKKAFGESAEGMAENALNLMNAMDNLFKNMLGAFGEDWQNLFKTQMIDLAAQGLSFDFYISAEDKGEFKDDWKKSWAKMTEGVIDPIVDAGTELLRQALDSTVTDATAWNYFTNEMQEYLRTSLEEGLEGLKVDWSKVTDQESFEAALEQMGLAAQQIADIVEYFEQVGAILETITLAIDMHEFSSDANAAIAGFRAINAEFEQYALTLESMGVDLEKYTDLEVAHLIALQDEAKAMSDAAMSGEDLALAFDYLTEGMDRAEGATSGYWELLDSTISGILESIEDIKKRHEDYGKTDIDLLLEKHPEWAGMTYEQWEEMSQDLENWSIEMLQEWRNLGALLETQWEGQQATLETALEDIADTNAKALQSEREEIERLIQAFTRATEAITDYQDQLLGGAAGMLPPDIQYAQASQQLAGAMQDIYSEDRDVALAAIQDIPGYISQFLKASEAFSATPEQYMADFARAMTILNTTQDIEAEWIRKLGHLLSSLTGGLKTGEHDTVYSFFPWGTPGTYPGSWVGDPPAGSFADDIPGAYGMQSGGIVSGPKSGYTAPITFHGTEHVVPGDQMAGVKNELSDIKEVLVMIMNTNGDQNKFTKKTYDILEQWDEDDGSLVVTQAT